MTKQARNSPQINENDVRYIRLQSQRTGKPFEGCARVLYDSRSVGKEFWIAEIPFEEYMKQLKNYCNKNSATRINAKGINTRVLERHHD